MEFEICIKNEILFSFRLRILLRILMNPLGVVSFEAPVLIRRLIAVFMDLNPLSQLQMKKILHLNLPFLGSADSL